MKRKIAALSILIFFTLFIPAFAQAGGGGASTHRIFRLSNASPESLVDAIKLYLSPDGAYAVDARTNSLVVRDYPENLEKIAQVIKDLDVPSPQVRIYVQFLGRSAGSSTSLYGGAVKGKNGWLLVADPRIESSAGSTSGTMNLAVMSGTSGFIKMGESVPTSYVGWFYDYALQRGYVAQSVIFREVTTGFYVTPQVRGDSVLLEIAPGVQYFDGRKRDRIIFKEAQTQVRLKDGQTMALGVSDSSSGGSSGLISHIVGTGSFQKNEVFSMAVTVKIIEE